jgi:hypothetical protein
MEVPEILEWVDRRQRELKLKDAATSRKAGHPDVIRNMRRGLSRPKTAALRALAQVLGDPPPGLFDEPSGPAAFPMLAEMEAEREKLLQEAEALRITIETLKARMGAG